MCGIVAVLRRPCRRVPPSSAELLARLRQLAVTPDAATLAASAGAVEEIDRALRGVAGVRSLLADGAIALQIDGCCAHFEREVASVEEWLDAGERHLATADVEAINAALLRLKDGLWAIRHDRLRTARSVDDLAGSGASDAALEAYASIQTAFSAIDRLEVRGRDSAGLHVLVEGHGLDLGGRGVGELLRERTADRLFTSGAVRTSGTNLAFVYKAAAEIGELGDNTRRLRDAVRNDELLRLAVQAPSARATVLGHTRWASVGIVSEANAHPLNQEEEGREAGPYVVAALNGDVDNYPVL
jgi:glucosamine--fructose-6-phosphate aminotransferase (isomerizing)